MSQQVRRQTFPLRLCDSLKREASRLAEEEQISLNHFIALAVAEKLSRLEQAAVFARKGAAMVPGTPFPRAVYQTHTYSSAR
jgi:hypothetical protein